MTHYEVVVIGGGPGGYVAAEEAAKYGKSVAIIEKDNLGGTCLNSGCIPSKTLLRHSEVLEMLEKARDWGIQYEKVTVSFDKMMARKSKVIENLRGGVKALLHQNNVQIYQGNATVKANKQIWIESETKQETITANQIILATGSRPFIPPIKGLSEISFHTSDTIFDIERLPKSIVIVGGGVIGVEFACIFSALNIEVNIIEMGDRLISTEDEEASKIILKKLKRDGVNIYTSSKVLEVSEKNEVKTISLENRNGEVITIETELLLLASGRTPNLSTVSELNLAMNGSFIMVNKQMQTSIPYIYAVGDVTGGWQLAHVASAEGIVAASNACHQFKEINYKAVPRCIYTSPEIASVGITEKEVIERNHSVCIKTIPLSFSGKAAAMDERLGFIKLIADKKYGEILGVVMVGPHVTEMISEASSFMLLEGTVNDIASMIHPHPTLSEGLWEAARAILKEHNIGKSLSI